RNSQSNSSQSGAPPLWPLQPSPKHKRRGNPARRGGHIRRDELPMSQDTRRRAPEAQCNQSGTTSKQLIRPKVAHGAPHQAEWNDRPASQNIQAERPSAVQSKQCIPVEKFFAPSWI